MPVALQSHGTFRAEDLLRPGAPEKFVEIVEGELIVMTPASRRHNVIADRFFLLFHEFRQGRGDLACGGDNEGFLVGRNPDVLLSPEACLFRKRALGAGAWLEFAPEIAVEVLSPSNSRAHVAYKTRKYFDAGAEQVWIADPASNAVEFLFRDGRRVRAAAPEVVRAEGLAEGLELDLTEIFADE